MGVAARDLRFCIDVDFLLVSYYFVCHFLKDLSLISHSLAGPVLSGKRVQR